jgi:adsorption protein A
MKMKKNVVVQSMGYRPIPLSQSFHPAQWGKFGMLGLALASITPIAVADPQTLGSITLPLKSKMQNSDNWLLSQLRQFRAYPYLDRAYKRISTGKLVEAAEEFKNYFEVESDDISSRVAYLNVLYKLKRYDDVSRQADILTALDPGNAQAQLFRGLVLEAKNKHGEALDVLLPLLSQTNADAKTKEVAAATSVDLALTTRRYDDAQKALSALPQRSREYGHLMRQGAAFAGQGKWAQSVAAYEQALTAAKTAPERRLVRETLFHQEKQNDNIPGAIAQAMAILEAEPDNAEWLRALAMMHYLAHDPGAALAVMDRLPAGRVQTQDAFFRANLLLDKKEYARALPDYARVAEEATDRDVKFRSLMGLGYAYSGLEQTIAAREAFERANAVQQVPEAGKALATVTKMLKMANFVSVERSGARSSLQITDQDVTQSDRPRRLPSRQGGISKKTAARPTVLTKSPLQLQQESLQQGYAAISRQNDESAVRAFGAAVEQGVDTVQTHLDMAFAYTRLKQWDRARDSFLYAFTLDGNLQNRLYVARSYVATGQADLALQYFQLIQPDLPYLSQPEQKAVLIEMGYLYAKKEDYELAAAVWKASVAYGVDAQTLLSLGYALEMTKRDHEALSVLEKIDPATLDQPAQLRLFSQLSRLYEKTDNVAEARNYMLKAAAVEPSAIKYYQVGLFEQKHKMRDASVEHLNKAFEMEPDNAVYAEQLAYHYKNNKEYDKAAALFERAIEKNPNRHALFVDLAYTYKQMGNNDQAVAWFKRSIDLKYEAQRVAGKSNKDVPANYNVNLTEGDAAPQILYSTADAVRSEDVVQGVHDLSMAITDDVDHLMPVSYQDSSSDIIQEHASQGLATYREIQLAQLSPSEDRAKTQEDITSIKQGQDEELYRMRQEVRELSRRFQFNLYQAYRSKSQPDNVASTPPGFFNSGAIPSQGGAELIYQPPGVGYQDGKIFQVFARGLWSNEPNSLHIAGKSVQGSVGARYKPLKTQDLFVSIERLFKIGSEAQNDWLARVSYAWTQGYDIRPNESSWNQTLFYGDLGYFFPNSGITALYSEIRQGRTFNYANLFTVTPHVMAAGRAQRPDPDKSSYAEVGAGVAVKYRFNENRYEAERSSAELVVQYRHNLSQRRNSGWVATAAVSF